MTEPFKDKFNTQVVAEIGRHIKRVHAEFDTDGFYDDCTRGLEKLELKERIARISQSLFAYLPQNNYEHAVAIMLDSLAPEGAGWDKGITGWGTLPLNHYASANGLDHFDISMAFFKKTTVHFSAEFDIRFFILAYPEQSLVLLNKWAQDANVHVRRLVSEGTRPRLPWAIKLQPFIDDPSPLLPMLLMLRNDEQEYVRRSVANSLNDIAKDHPNFVANIAREWSVDADINRQRLIKHACRTLIKQGHKPTLDALGYGTPLVNLETLQVKTATVNFGNVLVFEVVLHSESDTDQNLVIDYAIHHRKANGSTSPKVFKWKNTVLKAKGTLNAIKKHALKPITTRVYYNGEHFVELFVNGISVGKTNFELIGVKRD